jgi:hypothetical protein
MPNTCTICAHDQRRDVDHDLLGGASVRDVEGRYGVSKSAVDRHRRTCLRARAAAAIARDADLSVTRLESLATGLVEESMWGVLKAKQAIAVDPDDASARAEHRAYLESGRKALETLGRLSGIIGSGGPVVQIDARRQVGVLSNLTEDELRAALARADVIEAASVLELEASS